MIASAALALTLAAASAATLYDCSYETEVHQAIEEEVVTKATFERTGGFQARLSLHRDRAVLSDASGIMQHELNCTRSDTSQVALCATPSDRMVFVLFLRDGKFSISVRGQQEKSWVVLTGSCRPNRVVQS